VFFSLLFPSFTPFHFVTNNNHNNHKTPSLHHSRQIGAFVLEPLICAFSDWHAMSVPCQRGFPGVFLGLWTFWPSLKDQKFTQNRFFQYTNSTERDADQEKLIGGPNDNRSPKSLTWKLVMMVSIKGISLSVWADCQVNQPSNLREA